MSKRYGSDIDVGEVEIIFRKADFHFFVEGLSYTVSMYSNGRYEIRSSRALILDTYEHMVDKHVAKQLLINFLNTKK